jgi:protein-tyrosine phosphatase
MMMNTNSWENIESPQNDLNTISQITPRVFLSGIRPLEKSPEILRELGITHILSCVERNYIEKVQNNVLEINPGITILSLAYRDEISQSLWAKNTGSIAFVKKIRSDDETQELSEKLRLYRDKPLIEIGYRFIDDALRNGGCVLVHCMAGISRSSSVLIYYMMKKNNDEFREALQRLRRNRKIVCPNNSFWLQLSQYQILRHKYSDADSQAIIDYLLNFRANH